MKRAFTLIELLVVIAIIAILAAILFPVFAQAKLAAKKTAGLSQMKQIGTAVQIYAADFDDGLPTWSVFFAERDVEPVGPKRPSDAPELYWDFLLVPYVKNGNLIRRDAAGNFVARDYSGIWRSPGAEYGPEVGRSISVNQLLVWDPAVALNTATNTWTPDTNVNNGRYRWPNNSIIEFVSQTVFVADGGPDGRYEPVYFGDGYADKWLNRTRPRRSAPWRYGDDGANYVFTDGSAKYEKGNKMYPNPGPGVPFASWPVAVTRQRWCAAARWFAPTVSEKQLIVNSVPAGSCTNIPGIN